MVQLANAVNSDHANPPVQTRRQALQRLFSSPGKSESSSGAASRGLAYPALDLVKEILDVNNRSVENTLVGSIFNSVDLVVGFSEPFLDRCVMPGIPLPDVLRLIIHVCLIYRLLPYLLKSKVLTAKTLSTIVTASTRSLFPDGYPGRPPPIPSMEEQTAMREQLESRLKELVPGMYTVATSYPDRG